MLRKLIVVLLPLVLCLPVVAALPETAAAAASCRRTLPAYPVLEPGDQGPAVRTLQCTLNDLGVGPVRVDGDYGPQTEAAVAEVEATFEGPAPHPGRIDAGMWVLLFGRQLPRRLPHLGDQGREVRILQRALRAAGYTLAVDGDYGQQTRRVVRAYVRDFGDLGFCLRMGCA